MPVIDILIGVAVLISIIVGFIRGFIKEAISIASLLVAIWAALYFGPEVGDLSESWLSSEELQMWFGRVLIFAVVLSIGGLLGWGVSRLIRVSVLSGMDRFFGSLFGAVRGIILGGVFVIGGQFAGFDNDEWWLGSRLIPHLEIVAGWIKQVAPQGLELIVPGESGESAPVDLPGDDAMAGGEV